LLDEKIENNLKYYGDLASLDDKNRMANKFIPVRPRSEAPEDATIFFFINKILGRLEIKMEKGP
jgi:hypothetical protein